MMPKSPILNMCPNKLEQLVPGQIQHESCCHCRDHWICGDEGEHGVRTRATDLFPWKSAH
eukprot:5197343-Prorocentrum_lima.AAC.1